MIVSVMLVGCDLFQTRDPEDPGGGNTTQWRFPSAPVIVLQNLEVSFGRRSFVDYMRSFVAGDNDGADFEFIPARETVAVNPGIFLDWNIKRERQFIESLFNSAYLPLDSIAELTTTADRESIIGNEADLTADYNARIGHLREGAPREIAGRLEFHLYRENDGGWYIQSWADYKVTDKPCWSDLKANF